MTRDTGPRQRGGSAAAPGGHLRRHAHRPALEPLEGRPLLSSFYSGPSATRPVQTPGGVYTLSVSGPGLEKVRQVGHGRIAVTLFGTTPESTLNVALTRPRLHAAAASLQIASIRVISGQLGGFAAPGAVLNGPVTPLSGSVNFLQFGGLGPDAQIDVKGSLGTLSVSGGADLGPSGHVNVGGDVTQALSVGALDLAGGRVSIGHDVAGTLSLGAVGLTRGGQFLVAHDVTGQARVAGNLSVTGTNSLFSVGHNLTGGLSVGQGLTLDSNGQFAVGNDLTGPVTVGGTVSISNKARFIVNRAAPGTITVAGDLDLASGGTLAVGRTLNALTVGGDLTVAPTGGGITVGGDFNTLTVDGAFAGQGSAKAADLTVGLNLGALNVLGGGANLGGLQGADINVGKSILALNITHGIFDSLITAGVSINGGGGGGAGGNVGADGIDAILNSRITAGVSIQNLTIGGDVRSTFVANPASAGYPTRIVAGEDRQGDYLNGGLIDNFQITGALIDSVLAASVAPYGGNGTPPSSAYGAPPPAVGSPPGDLGFNTYDAPAGTVTGGTVGNPVVYQNYSEVSYKNGMATGVAYNTAIDPTIDDAILFGAINPSFAPAPLSQATLSGSTVVTTNQGTAVGGSTQTSTVTANDQTLPLPTKATVLGGVFSTVHGDEADFAGIFAADTRGVFVGGLPS